MPEEGIDFSKREDLLTYEEMIRAGKIFRDLGITKVRLTGGEPFVRKDMMYLLTALKEIFPSVHITTNATLIHHHIDELKALGINGLNISLDTLDRDKFFLVTRRDSFETVYENILKCIHAGLPTKINAVIMKGINDMEVPAFVEFAEKYNTEVRFIEAMPFNQVDGNKTLFIPHDEIKEIIANNFQEIVPIQDESISSSLKYLVNGSTKVGIIPAYSRTLCGSCNRIRLTPKGEVLTCLYSEKGLDLLQLLRDETVSSDQLKEKIQSAVQHKLKSGWEEEAQRGHQVFNSMTTIGG